MDSAGNSVQEDICKYLNRPGYHVSDETVSIPNQDFVSFAFDRIHEYDRERPIFVDAQDASRYITAPQIIEVVLQLAKGFRARGLRNGDCVCLHSFNTVYYPVFWLGVIAAGGVITGSNPTYTTPELTHHFKTTCTRFVVISQDRVTSAATDAITECQIDPSNVFIFGGEKLPFDEGYQSWECLLKCGSAKFDEISFSNGIRQKSTLCAYAATSGTTGLPKAAEITHRYLVAQRAALEARYSKRRGKLSQLLAIPVFHAFGAQAAIALPLRLGMTTYFLPRFDPDKFTSAISRFGITDTAIVPPIVAALLRHEDVKYSNALNSLRFIVIAGAPMNADVQARLYKHLSPSAVVGQCWGATELGWITLTSNHEVNNCGTVGKLLANTVLKIVSETGAIITEEGARGEARVKNASMMRSYRGITDAEANNFDADGFYGTGDNVYLQNGKLYIEGRIKDTMKVNGWQVSPEEIEKVIMQLSTPEQGGQVTDVCVIGTNSISEDDIEETKPRAYVVRADGSQVSEQTIKDHVANHLVAYKRLTGGVVFVDHIPRSPTGKILRRVLEKVKSTEIFATHGIQPSSPLQKSIDPDISSFTTYGVEPLHLPNVKPEHSLNGGDVRKTNGHFTQSDKESSVPAESRTPFLRS